MGNLSARRVVYNLQNYTNLYQMGHFKSGVCVSVGVDDPKCSIGFALSRQPCPVGPMASENNVVVYLRLDVWDVIGEYI